MAVQVIAEPYMKSALDTVASFLQVILFEPKKLGLYGADDASLNSLTLLTQVSLYRSCHCCVLVATSEVPKLTMQAWLCKQTGPGGKPTISQEVTATLSLHFS